jgi:LuxR family transcriptional regulator, maltose regulon positive regulatory protein
MASSPSSAASASEGRNPRYSVPESRDAVLHRRRLLDSLHDHIDNPLQIVSAPAGYGKTTLLADYARDTELPVCWYSADELDVDPGSFMRHLFASVQSRFPGFPAPKPQRRGGGADWRATISTFVESVTASVSEYFVLVIDDFHILAANKAIVDMVDRLVQRAPENMCLVLSTRETPQFPSLPRLISHRKVSGLGKEELRFNVEEIRQVLADHFDHKVSLKEAEKLEADSEGWTGRLPCHHRNRVRRT